MSGIAEFHFLRPYWLLAAIPVCVLLWLHLHRGRLQGVWSKVCDPALLPYVLVTSDAEHRRGPVLLAALVGLVLVAALAGPTWERLPTPVFRDQSALVLVLDLSRSMNAADLNPSRLDRARFKIADILRQRRHGQVGLVVYAAQAFVVTPLTDDAGTIEAQIPVLRTDLMPSQGSEPQLALDKAMELFKQAGIAAGDILLLTDGLGPQQAKAARDLARGSGMRLAVLGVGTPDGAPVPDERGGFLTDRRGNIVVEPLRETALAELARAGGGLYQRIRTDDADVQALIAFFESHRHDATVVETDRYTDRWREFGPWLLLPLLPVVALSFRRGVLVIALAMVIGGACPTPATAGWWLTPDQRGRIDFEREDYATAAAAFEDPAWRGAARYRAGDYDGTVEALGALEDPEAVYNRGNALARLGRYDEAIAAYDDVLAAVPGHEDALYNKALLEQLREPRQDGEQGPGGEDRDQGQDRRDAGNGDQGADPADGDGAAARDRTAPEEEPGAGDTPGSRSPTGDQDATAPKTGREPDEAAAGEEAASERAVPEDQAEEAEAQTRMSAQTEPDPESEQATEQWLRRIPDDPGGLLRRKFQYQYQQLYGGRSTSVNEW